MSAKDPHGLTDDSMGGARYDLGSLDAAAVDAALDGGGPAPGTHRVGSDLRPQDAAVARLLGLLSVTPVLPDPARDQTLIDATLARVARTRNGSERAVSQTGLSPDDEDALELLVSAGFNPARVPAGVRERARRHAGLLHLLDTPVAIGPADRLVGATLARVQASIDANEERMRFDEPAFTGGRRRFSDLISIAAVLVLAGSVLMPMAGAMREMSRRSACQANLSQAGLGFGLYAGDFRNVLPMASASQPGSSWWSIGDKDKSNSANLFTLARTGYTKSEALTCPGNPAACRDAPASNQFDWKSCDQISFSYQNLFASERPKWVAPTSMVVMSDRSPIVSLAMQGKMIHPLANTLQHDGRGQGALLNDGQVRWMRTPVLENGDNMFLPRPLEELIARLQRQHEAPPLNGRETPAGADDVFLAP